jgi:hypothetical protein
VPHERKWVGEWGLLWRVPRKLLNLWRAHRCFGRLVF